MDVSELDFALHIPEFARDLHNGKFDDRFSPYGPRLVDARMPYSIQFGDLQIFAECETVDHPDYPGVSSQIYTGKFQLATRAGTPLYDRTPDWWLNRFFRIVPERLSLFDAVLDMSRLFLVRIENVKYVLRYDGEDVCSAPWKVRSHLATVQSAGIERCRFFGVGDPFLSEGDRLAFFGEVL